MSQPLLKGCSSGLQGGVRKQGEGRGVHLDLYLYRYLWIRGSVDLMDKENKLTRQHLAGGNDQ